MSNQKIVTETALSALASDIKTALSGKANSNDVYPKSQTYNRTEIDNALDLKADKSELYNVYPTDQESGAIAHITDGADNIPVKSLVSQIVAIESGSGTKSPSNPYTISGFDSGVIPRCGKNIIDFASHVNSTSSGLTIFASSDGSINYNGKPSNSWAFLTPSFNYYLPSGTTITFSRQRAFDYRHYLQITFADNSSDTLIIENNTTSVTKTFTKSIIKLQLIVSGLNVSATYNDNLKLMLNIGTSALPYEAYNGNTYTFAFGQTVYGGRFDNKGNLVVTHGYYAFDGTETPIEYGSGYRYVVLSGKEAKSYGQAETPNLICNEYNAITRQQIQNGTTGISITGDTILLSTNTPSGVQVVYELANPITLSITSQDIPTLLGENNIFSNCGDVEVNYYADIGLYIDKKISSLAQA